MATLTAQLPDLDGLNPTYAAAAAGGDVFTNTGREVIHVKNGGGSPITVTVDAKKNCNYGFDHNSVTTVPAGEDRFIGPFDTQRFNNTSSQAEIAYSDVTTVTVAVLRVG